MFYTYYIKAEGKYYFGSRTINSLIKSAAKDDFMIKYFSSTTDDRLREIIRNKKYEKAGIIKEYDNKDECLKDEESLIRIFWTLYGTQNSWNHYANGKFSTSGTQLSEEHKQKLSESVKEAWNNKTDEEKEELYNKRSESIKKALNNKTDEEKQKIYKNISKSLNNMSEEKKQDRRKNISKALKGKPKKKFKWKTLDGEIIIMAKPQVLQYHPEWTLIGQVEELSSRGQ